MKRLQKFLFLVLSVTVFSCAEENNIETNTSNHELQATIPAYQIQENTRVSISQDLKTFTWSDGDKLGLYYEGTEEDGGAWFKIKHGGSSLGTFTNEGYALKPFKTYYAFYPHDYYATVTACPVNFGGMVQTENGGTAHIGERNYMYAVASTNAQGDINLNFRNLCAVIQLQFSAPIAGTYTSVGLSAENAVFTLKGTASMKDGSITTTEYTKDLQLSLGNGIDLQQNEAFTANLLMAPGNFSAETFTVSLSVDGKLYKCTLPGINVEAGKAYRLAADGYSLNGYYKSTDYSMDKTLAQTFQIASQGESSGADIIIVGDGFTDTDIASGYYDQVMQQAYEDFFAIEPFTTLRPKFNVYSVYAVSENQKMTEAPSDGINGAKDIEGVSTCFSTQFEDNSTATSGDNDKVFEYAKVALGTNANSRINRALVLVMINAERYSGTCSYYIADDSSNDYAMISPAVAYIPLGIAINGKDATTMRRAILHHEANGHGFGKLADEYWGSYVPVDITGAWENLEYMHGLGFYRNTDIHVNSEKAAETSRPETTPENVYWHSLFNTANQYETSESIGVYEGGNTFIYYFCRPTDNSIMRNNFGGFNAPSRWAIFYRAMKLTGSTAASSFEDSLNEFLAWDRTIDYSQLNAQNLTRAASTQIPGMKPLGKVQIHYGKWVNGHFVETK